MAESPLRVTSEYVRTYVGLYATAIGWTPAARLRLKQLRLISLDVIEVLRTGTALRCEKETADGALILMQGVTCDGTEIRVSLWSDAGIPLIKVIDVQMAKGNQNVHRNAG